MGIASVGMSQLRGMSYDTASSQYVGGHQAAPSTVVWSAQYFGTSQCSPVIQFQDWACDCALLVSFITQQAGGLVLTPYTKSFMHGAQLHACWFEAWTRVQLVRLVVSIQQIPTAVSSEDGALAPSLHVWSNSCDFIMLLLAWWGSYL